MVARISRDPLLQRFAILVGLSSDRSVIVRGNIKPLALARPVLYIEGFLNIFKTLLGAARVVVCDSQHGQRHGEIRIKLDRTLQVWNRTFVVELPVRGFPDAKFL